MKNTLLLKNYLRTILLLAFLAFGQVGFGQVTVASEGFNNTSTLFSVSGGAYYTGNSAASSTDAPSLSPFAVEGTHSYGISNVTATLTSNAINTSNYTGISMSVRLASFSIASTTNGADATDIITVLISPDGGTNYYSTARVLGNNNAIWSYSAGTGVATTTYDGNASPVDFSPIGGGSRTTDGYSTINITGLPAVTSLRVRILMTNNAATERWVLDDFKLIGTLSSSPTLAATASLSETTLSGSTIALTLSNDTFSNGSPVALSNFTLNNAPSGVTISSVVFNTSTTATVTLAYNNTDFDSTVSNMSVSIAAAEVTSAAALTSNSLSVTAVNETIAASPATLTGLNYTFGSGPSTSQFFNISSANLKLPAGNVTITGSTNYEVSTDNTNYFTSVTVPFTAATLASTPIYVRLKAGLTAANYNSQTITISGGGATSSVTVSGSVTPPAPANDLCSNAVTLSAGTPSNGTTNSATFSANTFTYASSKNDVWYTFTPTCTGSHAVTLTFSKPGSEDLDFDIFTTVCPITGIASFVAHGSTASETATQSLTSGTTYYIRVIDFSASNIAFTLNVTAPVPVTASVTAGTVSNLGSTSATLNGNVTALGVCPSTTAKGFVYALTSVTTTPTIANSSNTVSGLTTGAYTLNINSLIPNTSYTYSAYVYDGTTYTYSTPITFSTIEAATKLVLIGTPTTGNVATNLASFSVQAQNSSNSVDINYTGTITINKVSGSGVISGVTAAAVSGVATFNTVQFNAEDTYTINASAIGLITSTNSDNIVIILANASAISFSGASSCVSGAAGVWLTASNWCGATLPSSTTIAQFTNLGTNTTIGFNMNGASNSSKSIGAIEITNSATIAKSLVNSSTTVNGDLTLSGVVVNSTPNVILRNNSSFLFSINSSSNILGLILGNPINNIINIDGSGGISISSTISGSNPLTKSGSGSGILTLSGINTYSGLTTVTGGILQLNKLGGTLPPSNNVLVSSGATLRISQDQTLNTITLNGGTVSVDTGIVLTAATISVNGGGQFSGAGIIKLTDVLEVNSGNLQTGNQLILVSTATNTARVAPVSGTITGDVTVERYITGRRAFRFLTPSVTTVSTIKANWQNGGATTTGIGTQITGLDGATNGFDPSGSNNASLHTYNAQAMGTTSGFTPVTTTAASSTLKAGVGYRLLVRGDRNVDLFATSLDNMNVPTTLSAKGTLTTGTVTFDSTSGPALINNQAGNTQTNGYTLIGNPYASPVDWNAVTKTGVSNNAYYTWDPTLGTAAQRGRYVVYTYDELNPTVDGISSVYQPSTGTLNSANRRYLQTGQAVFIKNTDLAVPATLTFNEANKASANAYVFRTNEQAATVTGNSSLYLTVYDSNELAIGAAPIDGSVAVFGATYNNALDANDVDKLTTSGENLAFVRGNKNLAIETLAPVAANDELFVKTVQFQANKNYTFKVNTANFDTAVSAKMVDLYLNTETAIDLTQPSFVTFATTADANSYGANRFKIVFNNTALGNGSFNASAVVIYPNPIANNQFTLALPSAVTGKVTVSLSNMLGQEVYKATAEATPAMQIQPKQQLEEGVYIVSVTNNGQVLQSKVVVRK